MHRRILLLLLTLALLSGCQTATPVPSPVLPADTPVPTRQAGTVDSADVADHELLVMPDDGIEPVLDLIRGARESVRFKIYLLTRNDVMDELARAAGRGVDVRVIIEKEPQGGGESNQQAFDRLRQGGVAVRWAPQRYRLTHEKSLVIDDATALVGTFNYTSSAFNSNREYGLLTQEPGEVAGVADVFDADWENQPVTAAPAPLVLSPLNSRSQIEQLVERAQRSLWLEQSTLLDDAIAGRLAAAARRGVEVRFIGPLREDEDDIAMPNLKLVAEAGGQVVQLDDPLVHAKAILVDGELALIGSINLTLSSMDLNRELALLTTTPAALERLRRTMAADFAAGRPLAAGSVPNSSGTIAWQDAADHIGSEVTVEGRIVRTNDTGDVIYLNFTEDYRGTLSIVIFARDAGAFPPNPGSFYKDKIVRVTGLVKEYRGAPEIVAESPSQIEVLPEGSDTRSGAVDIAVPEATSSEGALTEVTWEEAGRYEGERVAVTGMVVRTHDTGKVTFLNFTEDWRGTFSVVIFPSDYDRFPERPADLYLNRPIRVTGKVKMYEGAPEIIVDSPDDIEFTGDAEVQDPAATEPERAPEGAPMGVVPWREAGEYVGQTITVEGEIVDTYDTGEITFLNFDRDHEMFVAVVFAEHYGRFPQSPDTLYAGKKVWVTGPVSEYRGTPQIIVESPDQIEVFD